MWALAYYVQTLTNLRDTREGRALEERLLNPAKSTATTAGALTEHQ